ncbi:hypothetical protein Plhal304r1_c012g0045641 [Plasmopara halstedii]
MKRDGVVEEEGNFRIGNQLVPLAVGQACACHYANESYLHFRYMLLKNISGYIYPLVVGPCARISST